MRTTGLGLSLRRGSVGLLLALTAGGVLGACTRALVPLGMPAEPQSATAIAVSTLAAGGRTARSSSMVCLLREARLRPARSTASVAMMPGPPALVIIATLPLRGSGWRASATPKSKSSSTESARMTPVCLKAASYALSLPASAPV